MYGPFSYLANNIMKGIRKPEAIPELEGYRLFERPDGFYWQADDLAAEHGPFATLLEALEDQALDMAPVDDEEPLQVAETLEEAEDEIGIAGWIDPESGEVSEEQRPRLEEH